MDIDPADPRFAASGFAVTVGDKDAEIRRLDPVTGQPLAAVFCRVALSGTKLAFYPQRSAAQRDVLAAMGVNP